VSVIAAALAHPTTATPLRPPNSLRRTSHIDMSFDDSGTGPRLWLRGRARDLFTDADHQGRVVAEAEVNAGLDEAHRLQTLTTTPHQPGLESLHGRVVGGGFRAALHQQIGASHAVRTPLYLLLDDLPVAALISGYTQLYRWGLGEIEPPDRGGETSMLKADICSGWRRDGTMMVHLRAGGRFPAPVGPPAPALAGAEDPLAWHRVDDLAPGGMRRRRLVEVTRGDPLRPLRVHAMFRDSHRGSDDIETVLHEYTVDAEVDPDTLVVLDCEATPRTLPWAECPAAAASAGRLRGQPVEGLRDFVRRELSGTTTCTHLNDLLRSLADVASLATALRGLAP
jgi:hypothetical protein